jgi:hypothetical protein
MRLAIGSVAVVVGSAICFVWDGRPGWADGLLFLCAWAAIECAYRFGMNEGVEFARRVPDFEKHLDDPEE